VFWTVIMWLNTPSFIWDSYGSMWLSLVMQGVSEKTLQRYSEFYCAARVRKTFTLRGVQTIHRSRCWRYCHNTPCGLVIPTGAGFPLRRPLRLAGLRSRYHKTYFYRDLVNYLLRCRFYEQLKSSFHCFILSRSSLVSVNETANYTRCFWHGSRVVSESKASVSLAANLLIRL
jgi:hypothetical protein